MTPGETYPTKARVSAFAHATEDPRKVMAAIFAVCQAGLEKRLNVTRTTGHHRNEIVIYHLDLSGRKEAEGFLKRVWLMLKEQDRHKILPLISEHLDASGKLHMRLDKQEALRGKLVLTIADPVKVEISFQSRGANNVPMKVARLLADLDVESKHALTVDRYWNEGYHKGMRKPVPV